jgi:glucose/arabinose dehydrogenase
MSPRSRRVLITAVVAVITGLMPGPGNIAQSAPTLPTGFTDELVVGVGAPTALAFTPDGRMLITTQTGSLRVMQGGSLLATPALNLSAQICANSERGLLGVAVDPQFATNHYIYLYYTFKKFGVCDTNNANAPVNRVARYVLPDNNVIDPASQVVLIDNIHSTAGNHNGGDLQFGKDGNLYISVGDGGCDYAGSGCAGANDAARDRHVLIGKILRVTRDGAIPAGNPFTGAGTARCNVSGSTTPGTICQETYAWGLRNPFRMAFDSNSPTTRFYVNDVGQGAWEEIDLGQAGADYGWNVREGHCANGSSTNCGPPPAGMTNPIHDYSHSTGCRSITGGAFVPNGVWPSSYDGSYLFADYVCGTIFKLEPNGSGGFTSVPFATGLGGSSAVHMTFGPHGTSQALYYTTYASGGQVRRIYFTESNTTPTAAMAASPTSGAAPLAVNFDGSGSHDPDGDVLTYEWDFGDGTTQTTTTPLTSHTYAAGNYTASLRVRDEPGALSAPATVAISAGNTPPTATIESPAAGSTFAVGQQITLTGSASDPQDGNPPASALSWTVLLHHNNDHTHPLLQDVTGNNITFTAPAPEDLQATAASFVEIQLKATDSGGLSTTVTRTIQPRKVQLVFKTKPRGLQVQLNGVTYTAVARVTSWEGYQINVFAPSPQGIQKFRRWSDGGAQAHTILTPAARTVYTAIFRK